MQNFIEFDLIKGKTFSETITVTDSQGLPFNFSGYDVRGTIRSNYGQSGVVGNFNVIVANESGGILALQVGANDSTGFAPIRAIADIEAYTSGDGVVIPVVPFMRLNIYPEVSREY
jgi:hypothetical protein